MNFPNPLSRTGLNKICGSLHGPHGVREYENAMPFGCVLRSYVISHKPRSLHHVTDKSPSVPSFKIGVASDSLSLHVGAFAASRPAKKRIPFPASNCPTGVIDRYASLSRYFPVPHEKTKGPPAGRPAIGPGWACIDILMNRPAGSSEIVRIV